MVTLAALAPRTPLGPSGFGSGAFPVGADKQTHAGNHRALSGNSRRSRYENPTTTVRTSGSAVVFETERQGRVGEPEWKEVAADISCKLLATDAAKERVSMLVRLAPGAAYPPHTHAGLEELHLLDRELWIDDRELFPGDYNRGEPGTGDSRVWSETGCTCVLVTSFRDILR